MKNEYLLIARDEFLEWLSSSRGALQKAMLRSFESADIVLSDSDADDEGAEDTISLSASQDSITPEVPTKDTNPNPKTSSKR